MRFGSVHGTSYTRNDQTMDCWIISLTFLKKTKQPFSTFFQSFVLELIRGYLGGVLMDIMKLKKTPLYKHIHSN